MIEDGYESPMVRVEGVPIRYIVAEIRNGREK
jgi:hypothetical protein